MKLCVSTLLVSFLIILPEIGSTFASGPVNLIENGSFEVPVVVGGNQEFGTPSTAITGWHVSAGSIDLITSGSILGSAHSGLQMIDINGSSSGRVEQSFATVPGNTYRLALFYSNNPNPAFALPIYSASVSVVGTTQLLNALVAHAGATELQMNWMRFANSFTADSTTTKLVLSSAHGGFNGIYFDSVSVIPEPAVGIIIAPAAFAALSHSRRLRPPQG
ncbi:DUF642 domain-containing protein [Lacipirellula sp.]|uniref:DUF642 domain-containing protein n=1 Tax=Lacipirellula sp. TaxID=2691419 RepID=UPI003D0FB730